MKKWRKCNVHFNEIIVLLSSKRNRRVWQSMICLSLIADRKPKDIYENRAKIAKAMERGSIITQDHGLKTLAKVASANNTNNQEIFPYLMKQLRGCRAKSVPQYAESILCAVNSENVEEFREILAWRFEELSASQQRRVKAALKKMK